MDLVEDDRGDPRQHRPARPGAEHDVQALGGGDEDLRLPPQHLPALFGRRVAAPGQDAYIREIRARRPETRFQLLQGRGKVPPDVVVQAFSGET
jgi:hypothetical protein